jgi:hypothetical protein
MKYMQIYIYTSILISFDFLIYIIYIIYIGPGWLNEVGNWTTKTGRHDIAESGVKHQKINQSIYIYIYI